MTNRHFFERRIKQRGPRRARRQWAKHGRHAVMAFAIAGLDAASLAHGQTGVMRAAAAPLPASTQVTDERWKESFDEFDAADRLHAPQPGGVLFVGSSSIRLWDKLKEDFASLPIVTQRGFGGSRLADSADNVARLVLPYRPKLVIVYAGDNDLAEGATPADVLASFTRFVQGVRRELPDTRIAYVSIKPSPSRAELIERVRATNSLIEAYTAKTPNLDYIDIYSKMMGADGKPRAELFGPDMLHLNRSGYALWRAAISAHLGPLADQPGAALESPANSSDSKSVATTNGPRSSP